MKTKLLLIAALMGFGVTGALHADDDTDANVQITFDHSEKFTDIRDGFTSTKKGEQAYLDQIEDYVRKQAAKYLPEGHTLAITFTNIDLAGEFEPWGKAGMDDVRIVKGIYPPRIDLSFKVTDAAGATINEGERELRDLNFMMNLRINNEDRLRYEKTLLDDWMRKDVRPSKK